MGGLKFMAMAVSERVVIEKKIRIENRFLLQVKRKESNYYRNRSNLCFSLEATN